MHFCPFCGHRLSNVGDGLSGFPTKKSNGSTRWLYYECKGCDSLYIDYMNGTIIAMRQPKEGEGNGSSESR